MADIKFEIAKLELKTGDILVVKMPKDTPEEKKHRAAEKVKSMLPASVGVLVYSDDTELSVIRASKNS